MIVPSVRESIRSRLSPLLEALQGSGDTAALARASAGVFALKVVSVLLTLAAVVVLARVLGPAQFGIYSFVLALVSILILPSRAGITTLTVREVAAQHALSRWSLMRGYLRWSTTAVLVLSLSVATISLIALLAFRGRLSTVEFQAALWGLVLIPLFALNSLRAAVMRGLSEAVRGIAIEATVRPACFLVLLVALAALSGTLDASSALALQVLATAAALALGAWWLRALRPRGLLRADPETDTAAWLSAVVPLTLLTGIQQVLKYTDVLLLGYFQTAADVGIYRIATQGADLVLFVLVTVTMVLAPQVARLRAASRHATLQKLVTFTSRIVFAAAAPLALLLILAGEPLIRLVFGAPYAPGHNALAILCLGQLGVALFGIAPIIMKMSGHERASVVILGACAVMNLLLNLILIPPFGMEGAAAATAFSVAAAHLAMGVYVRRAIGVNTFLTGPRRS